ncbi:Protein of unknown function [Pyronema omphalodes CBS 100304]|uniref:Uncharacterized protein n=1 Tax=Pyronema omphalodes (strain CBS 100304) TaxID=1076935 RepID=U4L3U7_PYROM|nr:Protein of unknown function [Pyronema omphalodes CBS 100304]
MVILREDFVVSGEISVNQPPVPALSSPFTISTSIFATPPPNNSTRTDTTPNKRV